MINWNEPLETTTEGYEVTLISEKGVDEDYKYICLLKYPYFDMIIYVNNNGEILDTRDKIRNKKKAYYVNLYWEADRIKPGAVHDSEGDAKRGVYKEFFYGGAGLEYIKAVKVEK